MDESEQNHIEWLFTHQPVEFAKTVKQNDENGFYADVPLSVVYFSQFALNDIADYKENNISYYLVDEYDKDKADLFPELSRVSKIGIWTEEDGNGNEKLCYKFLSFGEKVYRSVSDVVIERQDLYAYKVADEKTRVSVIQNIFFPKLEILLKFTLEYIQEIYEINPYELYSFVYRPSNRKTSKLPNFSGQILVGISGKKTDEYLRIRNHKNERIKYHPSRIFYEIREKGTMRVCFQPITYQVERTYFEKIRDILSEAGEGYRRILTANRIIHENARYLEPIETSLSPANHDIGGKVFISPDFYLPVDLKRGFKPLTSSFLALYPMLDALTNFSIGKSYDIKGLVKRYERFWREILFQDEIETFEELDDQASEKVNTLIDKYGEDNYNLVNAGLWYQVLARDKWTCLSCGRTSKDDGVKLEVDHIIPRSKGGKDEINNLQTLCKKCNIGKSNKDSTDLRR